MLNKKWRQKIIDTEYINERVITATVVVNHQRNKLMRVYFSHSGYADHHVEKCLVVVGWLGRGTTTLHCTHLVLAHRLKVLNLFLVFFSLILSLHFVMFRQIIVVFSSVSTIA